MAAAPVCLAEAICPDQEGQAAAPVLAEAIRLVQEGYAAFTGHGHRKKSEVITVILKIAAALQNGGDVDKPVLEFVGMNLVVPIQQLNFEIKKSQRNLICLQRLCKQKDFENFKEAMLEFLEQNLPKICMRPEDWKVSNTKSEKYVFERIVDSCSKGFPRGKLDKLMENKFSEELQEKYKSWLGDKENTEFSREDLQSLMNALFTI